jgi:hypothetical protein
LLGKSVLDGDILSLNPSKVEQLPAEHVQEARATSSSVIIQETDAGDFSRLLCLAGPAKRKEHGAKGKVEDALTDY